MTEESKQPTDEGKGQGAKDWFDEAEDALEKAGVALRAAWDASRDARMSALESAKKAAKELGDAIDRGVAGAKERWEAASQQTAEPGTEPETSAQGGPAVAEEE